MKRTMAVILAWMWVLALVPPVYAAGGSVEGENGPDNKKQVEGLYYGIVKKTNSIEILPSGKDKKTSYRLADEVQVKDKDGNPTTLDMFPPASEIKLILEDKEVVEIVLIQPSS